jgi:hypothetical protein
MRDWERWKETVKKVKVNRKRAGAMAGCDPQMCGSADLATAIFSICWCGTSGKIGMRHCERSLCKAPAIDYDEGAMQQCEVEIFDNMKKSR